ncbi:aspartyl protease family protein [Kiritimatiellota bacterium B12222]|nr:aspartyl protease family protein [Kiritimatiellota bacterium B12222]
MKCRLSLFSFIWISLWGCLLPADDVVTLKNGNVLRGVISVETPTHLVLEMPGLKLTLTQDEIKNIEKMDAEARDDAIEEVRAPRPYQEEFYPENIRPLFRSLVALDEVKSQWQEAQRKTAQLETDLLSTQRDVTRLRRSVENSKKQLDQFSLSDEESPVLQHQKIEAHNALVKQTNLTIGRIRRKMDQLDSLKQQIERSVEDERQKRNDYAVGARWMGEKWVLFTTRLQSMDDPEPEWFPYLDQRMKQHPAAFQVITEKEEPPFVLTASGNKEYVLPKGEGGHYHVAVTLNRMLVEDFMIDTGATFCILSESIGLAAGAREIGPAVDTKVADGRLVKVLPAVIDEMNIYGQNFGPVTVGLIAEGEEMKVPSLLGMNVISNLPLRLTPEGLLMTITPEDKNTILRSMPLLRSTP